MDGNTPWKEEILAWAIFIGDGFRYVREKDRLIHQSNRWSGAKTSAPTTKTWSTQTTQHRHPIHTFPVHARGLVGEEERSDGKYWPLVLLGKERQVLLVFCTEIATTRLFFGEKKKTDANGGHAPPARELLWTRLI